MAKMIDRDTTGRTVLLTGVRISFGESLQEKKLVKGANRPTHHSNFIIPRDGKDFDKNVEVIKQALRNTCKEAKRPENWWEGLYQDEPKQLCFRDGRHSKDREGKIRAGYEGNLFIAAKGPKAGEERPSKMLDRHKRPVEEKDINDVFYNGTLCDAQIAFYYTDKHGSARITCSIEGLRSHQEGDRLGGGGTYVDADDFDDFEGDDDGFDSPSSTSSASSGSSTGLIL